MIVLGAIFALVAAVAAAYAIVLQASQARLTAGGESMRLALLRRLAHRRRWLLGSALLGVTWGLQLIALALAPIAIVQPMLATSQLALLALARAKLGERIGRSEALAAGAIMVGIAVVVWAAPRQDVTHAPASSLAPPMAVVGVAAVVAYLIFRAHARARLLIVIGAGIAYSWSDFASKLLAGEASGGRWALASVWAAAAVAIGVLAFLEENTAPVPAVGHGGAGDRRDQGAAAGADGTLGRRGPLGSRCAAARRAAGWPCARGCGRGRAGTLAGCPAGLGRGGSRRGGGGRATPATRRCPSRPPTGPRALANPLACSIHD